MTCATKLNDETIIAIHEDDGSEIWAESARCTWKEFQRANEEGFDVVEMDDVKSHLERTGFYSGGGGAFAQYELRLIEIV